MRTWGKSVGFLAVIGVAALWPIVQIQLVHQHDLNRWELFGWGMYTIPVLPAEVRLQFDDERPARATWPQELQDEARAFQSRWRTWGRLVSAEALAAQMRAWRPDARRLLVRAIALQLDRESGNIVAREDRYVFEAATGAARTTRHLHRNRLP